MDINKPNKVDDSIRNSEYLLVYFEIWYNDRLILGEVIFPKITFLGHIAQKIDTITKFKRLN